MSKQKIQDERIAKMIFASVYPHYVTKVEKKNRKVFEKDASDATQLPFYIKEQLHTGQLLAAEIRDFYHPIYYIYPRS